MNGPARPGKYYPLTENRRALNIMIVLAGALLLVDSVASYGQCPPKNKVYNKDPVCHTDADCQKYGKLCCPNQYNTKSCTYRAPYNNNRNPRSVEVCKVDPLTKGLSCTNVEF